MLSFDIILHGATLHTLRTFFKVQFYHTDITFLGVVTSFTATTRDVPILIDRLPLLMQVVCWPLPIEILSYPTQTSLKGLWIAQLFGMETKFFLN